MIEYDLFHLFSIIFRGLCSGLVPGVAILTFLCKTWKWLEFWKPYWISLKKERSVCERQNKHKKKNHTNVKACWNREIETGISIHKPFNGIQNAAKGRMKDGQSGTEIEAQQKKGGCYLNRLCQISDYTLNSRSKLNQYSSFCHFKNHAKTWLELKCKCPCWYMRR